MSAVPLAAEAARYALLRRLAPSFRHHLVVNLQPIGMICEVVDRRLRAPAPDVAHVQDSTNKISGFARAALGSCVEVVGWLAPDDAAVITVPDGVRDCATLLATSLSFRGFALRNEVDAVPGTVSRAALRALLTGALMHATDHHPAPADLVLTARAEPDGARLRLELRANEGDNAFRGETHYRALTWEDVQALAAADAGEVTRGERGLELHLPWKAAPAG